MVLRDVLGSSSAVLALPGVRWPKPFWGNKGTLRESRKKGKLGFEVSLFMGTLLETVTFLISQLTLILKIVLQLVQQGMGN